MDDPIGMIPMGTEHMFAGASAEVVKELMAWK